LIYWELANDLNELFWLRGPATLSMHFLLWSIYKNLDPSVLIAMIFSWVAQGVLIIPHGAIHALYHVHSPDALLPLDRVLEDSGFERHGVLVHGGGDGQREEA